MTAGLLLKGPRIWICHAIYYQNITLLLERRIFQTKSTTEFKKTQKAEISLQHTLDVAEITFILEYCLFKEFDVRKSDFKMHIL